MYIFVSKLKQITVSYSTVHSHEANQLFNLMAHWHH